MKQTFTPKKLATVFSMLESKSVFQNQTLTTRNPIHVVYGGAHLFTSDTPKKLGKLALKSLETYAPNFAEFASAMWLPGADTLPQFQDFIKELEFEFTENADQVKAENYNAWLAWTIYRRTIEKLQSDPIEDFRIDFEDGYGFRTDAEEDGHAISASNELAKAVCEKTITAFSGFRIKSFAPETFRRAIKTLDLFLTNLVEKTKGKLPENFVVTLPKIIRTEEAAVLDELLTEFEKQNKLENGAIKIEIMVETPQAIMILPELVEAANGRCTSAHFGAYDYTASFGISATHQHFKHEACNFARQMMQISLAPLGVHLSDSVTTELPIPIYKGRNLTKKQLNENKRTVQNAWRKHFNNVTNSLINGFYQSWDLHPAQLVARYAAVYSFFLESKDSQAERLKGFIEKATQAMMTGNRFDDAASAQGLLNFFISALNCGAMTEAEILESTGLNIEDLRAASFVKIMQNQRNSE